MPKLYRDNRWVPETEWGADDGITLAADCDLENVGIDFAAQDLICLEFPGFMDGRAFSIARTLREQHDFKGELRATGEFIPDQLHYLMRCGFNAFLFSTEVNESTIEECVNAFSEHYQAAVDDPQPLFRKRA